MVVAYKVHLSLTFCKSVYCRLSASGLCTYYTNSGELKEGVQITVPAGIKHEIFDVTEELLIYDVFAPGTF